MADAGFWAGLFGGSGGVLALIGATAKVRGSRQQQFEKRVDEELRLLRSEVAECRQERPQMLLLVAGVRMLVADAREKDRTNPVLKQVASALGALPADNSTFDQLLKQLNDIPGTREMRERDQ